MAEPLKEKLIVIKSIAPTLGKELTKKYLKKLLEKRKKKK